MITKELMSSIWSSPAVSSSDIDALIWFTEACVKKMKENNQIIPNLPENIDVRTESKNRMDRHEEKEE